jgi:precorrin-8X/cobalt-precorrin-8 methylmutase
LIACGNPVTRAEAMEIVTHLVATEADLGNRVLAGFDFPFGYPAGVAKYITGGSNWKSIWAHLAQELDDSNGNRNNRFALAGKLNASFDDDGPFWGNGTKNDILNLPRHKPHGWGKTLPSEWRVAEHFQKSRPGANPKSVWQLSGVGTVGGQVLTGLPALEKMRHDPKLRERVSVWPFETGLNAGQAPIVMAEIYPSLLNTAVARRQEQNEVKDRAQVRVNAFAFSQLDERGLLQEMFAAAEGLTVDEQAKITSEEAWILGAGFDEQMRSVA